MDKPAQHKSTVPGSHARALAHLRFHQKVTANNVAYGGIHPIVSLISHRSHLAKLVQKSLEFLPGTTGGFDHDKIISLPNGQTRQKPDFISVTRGPGNLANLSCGLDTAKGIAAAWQIPLVGVHHMQAHALTPRLLWALDENGGESPLKPEFPFLTLLVSGGHTTLVHSTSLTKHVVLANTKDNAIGDILDKIGRLVLPETILSAAGDTSFAKYLSQYAFPDADTFSSWPIPVSRGAEIDRPVNRFGWSVQTPLADTRELAFSFSGISTRIHSLWTHRQAVLAEQRGVSDEERLVFARTALGTAFEHLASRTVIALEQLRASPVRRVLGRRTSSTGSGSRSDSPAPRLSDGDAVSTLVVSGGVASNMFLRHLLRRTLDFRGFSDVDLVFPPVEFCTDNAAMIGWAGLEMYEAGIRSDLDIGAVRKWPLDRLLDEISDEGSELMAPALRHLAEAREMKDGPP